MPGYFILIKNLSFVQMPRSTTIIGIFDRTENKAKHPTLGRHLLKSILRFSTTPTVSLGKGTANVGVTATLKACMTAFGPKGMSENYDESTSRAVEYWNAALNDPRKSWMLKQTKTKIYQEAGEAKKKAEGIRGKKLDY